MEDDLELRRIQLKRMMKMASRLYQEEKPKEPEKPVNVFEKIRPYLVDRADEVLDSAKEQYPEEAEIVAKKLLTLIEQGILDKIDGPSLYNLLRNLGLRVKIDTRVMYVKRGESKDLSELIRQKLK